MANKRNDRKDQRRKEALERAKTSKPRKEFTYTSETVGLLWEQSLVLKNNGHTAAAKESARIMKKLQRRIRKELKKSAEKH